MQGAKQLHFNKDGEAMKRMQAGVDKLATVVGVTLGPKVHTPSKSKLRTQLSPSPDRQWNHICSMPKWGHDRQLEPKTSSKAGEACMVSKQTCSNARRCGCCWESAQNTLGQCTF